MSDLRILMIGPGNPNEANSGLGIAVHEIAKHLSRETSMIHIQPVDAEAIQPSEKTFVESDTFNTEQVTKDLIRVAVRSGISTYVYGPEESSEAMAQEPEMKAVWEQFTKDSVKKASTFDFDVIYAHDWPAFQAGIELKKKSGKPLVLHVHSLDIDRLSTLHHSWVYELEKAGLEAADHIITVSKYSADRLQEFYEIAEEKIEVIYNGVHRAFQRKSLSGKPILEPAVLFVGRLTSQKGPFSFLEIAKMVLEKHPEAKFILAGEGEQRDHLIEFAANKKIGDRVYFTGYLSQDKLLNIYRQATIFCMPSKSDPFGLAALEAAAAGLPIVLSKQCGVAEVLPGALKANYDEQEQLATYISSLLDEPDLRSQHASRNESSVSLLSWKKTAAEVLETLTMATT